MSHVRRFDHVGLTVADLDVATAFFVALGLEVEGRAFVEGEFLDTVGGIPDSGTEIVMLKPPDDGTRLELSSFVRPDSVPGSPAAMANELGLRNVAFEVKRPAGGCRLGSYRGLRPGRWHRRVRGRLADGLRPGAGRDHRLTGRAHRLSLATPASAAPSESQLISRQLADGTECLRARPGNRSGQPLRSPGRAALPAEPLGSNRHL
jgi:catechol 2,3-dioxygenase-like lactoylglutathione lyase family enzyme